MSEEEHRALFETRPRDEPETPENVRVMDKTGAVFPCELIYADFVDGMHRWIAVTTIKSEKFDRIMMDKLPAKTSVVINFTD